MEKKLIFKYTVKIPSTGNIETHYVSAYTEELARVGLSKTLNVDKDILRLSNRNLPFKVRAAIADLNNKEYFLTVDVAIEPIKGSNFDQQRESSFNLKASVIVSLKYNIMALARHDKELLLKYSDPIIELENYIEGCKKLYYYSPEFNKKIQIGSKFKLSDYYTFGQKSFKRAYEDLRATLLKEELEELILDNGQNALDVLDSLMYSVNISDDNYEKMKKDLYN